MDRDFQGIELAGPENYIDPGSPGGLSEVVSMVEDDQKYLWVGTSGGIVRVNPQRNETSTFGINYGVGETHWSLVPFTKN